MLSRTAANLYWATRYFERVESTARLLDAYFQPGLPFNGDLVKLYALPLQTQGVHQEFINEYGADDQSLNMENVSRFLISSNSMASVKYSLELARENARSERSCLSSEVWEVINQTWLEFQEWQHKPVHIFIGWFKQQAFLFQATVLFKSRCQKI